MQCDNEDMKMPEIKMSNEQNSSAHGTSESDYPPFALKQESDKVADAFEPINIEGQQGTIIWVHHPGSEGPRTWEPRKGKNRNSDDGYLRKISGSINSTHLIPPGRSNIVSSTTAAQKRTSNKFNKVFRKLGSFCSSCRLKKKDSSSGILVPEETNGSDSIKVKRHGKSLTIDTESTS